ncbi:hypothetical protein [Roseateles oligotrophus]|uniref:Porin n=1 Tax=Roseateles oligotrophus TaxID=1769250 RepID=A0ABT2YGR1_9BURK|nr:hypothetical protein [Roseateles oligotrophus]MCV2369251.1 hypothetical protein [Roseateles oligotrophus]
MKHSGCFYRPQAGLLLACALLAAAPPLRAQVQEGLKLSGFGTLALTRMDSEQGDFKGTFGDVPLGAGRSQQLSAKPDSRLAAQANYGFSEQLEGVAQLMVRYTHLNNYRPALEMLNLQYNFDRNNSLRAGRMPHPFFLASDYRLIGYANPFARAPVEVHLQSIVTHSDGLQLRHRRSVGDASVTLQMGYGVANYAGASKDPHSAEDKGKFNHLISVDAMYESNALMFRLVHNRGISDYESNSILPLFTRATAENPTLADELSLLNKRVTFTGLGAVYDPGEFLLQAEYTWIRWGLGERSIVPDTDAFYAMGGWRLGSLMPYGIYAKRRTAAARIVTGFTSPAINAGMNTFAAQNTQAQHSVSLGLRWDFRANMALKLQWDRITVDSPAGASYLINLNPLDSPKQGQQFHVLGLNLDFVF